MDAGGGHDLVPGKYNGEPALTISADFKSKICAPWQRALVVRLLGLRIGFTNLCNRLKGLWRPQGNMEVKDLDHDCFLVNLDNEQDYYRALTDGPWVIYDHYLVVQQWSPRFKASDPLPKTMIVWVQLPALKIHFYHREILTSLGNLIGRTIKLDYHTLTQQRAKFARLAVEVDLTKHLVPRIWLDDEWQKVEYENLSEVCFKCGKIGHDRSLCPDNQPAPILALPAIGESLSNLTISPESASATSSADSNPGFGPWMLVTRKSRRNSREAPRKGKLESDTGKSNKEGLPQSGKGGTTIKDPPQDLPLQKKLNGPLPSSAISPVKKSPNSKKGNSETIRGNEKAGTDASGKGKGVLGPGPSFQKVTNSSGPSSSFNGAYSSSIETGFQPTSSPGPEPTDY
ncbi:unnamed protein product [Linum tenue]|uniref:CCHC-type domain-containing protein n=1 Tax=Linum tenue TaxID=586396 RepID=A0AAV0I1G0_9ROSI|nr:unnamed protein product [Linum tenue]